MNRRSFITSALQSLAIVGALKLGLGNMTSEDVRIAEPSSCLDANVLMPNWQPDAQKYYFVEAHKLVAHNAKLIAYSPITMEVKGWSIDGKVWTVPYNNIEHGDIICDA